MKLPNVKGHSFGKAAKRSLTSLKKSLLILTLISAGLLSKSYGQIKKSTTLPNEVIDSMNVAIVEGMKAKIEAFTYKKDLAKADSLIAAREKEIIRKEGVIVSQIEKNKICYQERDLLQMQMKGKDEIIATQGNTIKRLGSRPKHWQLGIGGGYGYNLGASVTRSFSVGVFVTRQLLRF